jgi:protein-arginine kinase activator protein McsA
MFTRQHGTCAICLQMVSETLCVDRCPNNAAARHLVCDECAERHRSSYAYDPDVARLVASNRARIRCEDDG